MTVRKHLFLLWLVTVDNIWLKDGFVAFLDVYRRLRIVYSIAIVVAVLEKGSESTLWSTGLPVVSQSQSFLMAIFMRILRLGRGVGLRYCIPPTHYPLPLPSMVIMVTIWSWLEAWRSPQDQPRRLEAAIRLFDLEAWRIVWSLWRCVWVYWTITVRRVRQLQDAGSRTVRRADLHLGISGVKL